MPKSKFTPSQVVKIRTDYVQNPESFAALARRYGTSSETISRVIHGRSTYSEYSDLAPGAVGGRAPAFSDESAYEALAAIARGATQVEVAKEYGVSPYTVNRLARRKANYAHLPTEKTVNRARTAFYRDHADLTPEIRDILFTANPYVAALPYRTRGWTRLQAEVAIADYVRFHGEAGHEAMFPDYYGVRPVVEPVAKPTDSSAAVAALTAERDALKVRVSELKAELCDAGRTIGARDARIDDLLEEVETTTVVHEHNRDLVDEVDRLTLENEDLAAALALATGNRARVGRYIAAAQALYEGDSASLVGQTLAAAAASVAE